MISRNRFNKIGRIIGFILAVLFPFLTAPQGLSWPFELGGIAFAMLGFTTIYEVLKATSPSKIQKWLSAFFCLILRLATAKFYSDLVNDPEHATPDATTEALEFVFFCFAHFGMFGFIAFTYRSGGAFLLRALGQLPPDAV